MGWTFHCYNSPRNHSEEKAEIEKLCTFETTNKVARPIQTSKVGSVWYVAVKVLPKVGHKLEQGDYVLDSDGGYTFAAVFLTARRDGEWGYKDIDENMGPNAAQAPVSLIRRLSELADPDGSAKKWRASCRSFAESKPPALKEGDIIQTNPIKLTNGMIIQKFRVGTYYYRGRNRKIYTCLENGANYSLRREHLQGLKILERTA